MSYRDQRSGMGEQQDLSEKSSSQRPSRAPVVDVFQASPSPGQESPRTLQRPQRRRGEPAAQQETEFRSLDDYEAMLQEMTSPALGPKDGRATTTPAPPRRQERDARADRTPRPPRRQPHQQEPEQQQQQQQQGPAREQRPRLQPRQTPDQQQQRLFRAHHADQMRTMNISVPSQYQASKLSSLGLDPAFDERKLKRRSSLPSHLKDPTTTDTTTTDGLTSSVQRRNSDDQQLLSSTLAVELSVSNDILSRKGTALNRPNGGHHHHQGGAAPLVQLDYSALSSSVPSEPKRFSWENESVTTRADLLQGHDIRPKSLQRKGSWLQPLSDESPESEQSSVTTATAVATATAPEGRHAQPLRTGSQNSLNGSQPALVDTPTGPSSVSRSHSPMSVEASTQQQQQQQQQPPPPAADNDDYLSDGSSIPVPKGRRPSRSTGTLSRPNTPVGGIRPPPGPAPASASSGIVQISRKVSPPSKKRSGSGSNSNNGGSSAGNGGGKLGSPSTSSSEMLQPIVRGTRPRAGSSASVSSLGSVGSIIVLDRSLTPPPPSSPLPSLPPPPPHHVPPPRIPLPPLEGPAAGGVIGLGLDPLPVRTRKASGGKDQLFSAVAAAVAAVPPLPPHVVLNAEGARTHDSDLMAQLDAMRAQLAEKDDTIAQLKAEQRTRRPSVQKVGLMEQELMQAKGEIQRLQGVMEEKEQSLTTMATTTTTMMTGKQQQQKQQQQQAARQEALVFEMEALKQTHQVQEKARLVLEQEVLQLRSEKTRQEERLEGLERELSTLKARSEQEVAVHTRTVQENQERWHAQKMHLESQHTRALTDLTERHQQEKDTLVETTTRQERLLTTTTLAHYRRREEKVAEAEAEIEAREKVLRDRLLEQTSRYDQLADSFFQMEKTLATTLKEKETMARTNRSLERHLSMQHLQEQENLYRKEELERENAELRELVSELDMAVAKTLAQQQQQQQQHNEEEGALAEEEKEKKKTTNGGETMDREQQMMATFEQQYRKWMENAELMAQKLARAEDETRKVLAQNEKLQVALELSHTNRQALSVRSPTPSA